MGKCESKIKSQKKREMNVKDEEVQEIEKIIKKMNEDILERKNIIEYQSKIEKEKINEVLNEKKNNEKELKEKLIILNRELEELVEQYNNCQLDENVFVTLDKKEEIIKQKNYDNKKIIEDNFYNNQIKYFQNYQTDLNTLIFSKKNEIDEINNKLINESKERIEKVKQIQEDYQNYNKILNENMISLSRRSYSSLQNEIEELKKTNMDLEIKNAKIKELIRENENLKNNLCGLELYRIYNQNDKNEIKQLKEKNIELQKNQDENLNKHNENLKEKENQLEDFRKKNNDLLQEIEKLTKEKKEIVEQPYIKEELKRALKQNKELNDKLIGVIQKMRKLENEMKKS